jgi:hypothetical protein
MHRWIQKHMLAERKQIRLFMGIGAAVFLMMALAFLYAGLEARFHGLEPLDSAAKIEAFSQGRYSYGTMKYLSAEDTQERFTVTTTSQADIASLPITTTDDKEYAIWYVEGADYGVFLCTQGGIANGGPLTVSSSDQELIGLVKKEYELGDDVIVLLQSTDQMWLSGVFGGLLLILLLIRIWLGTDASLLRRTSLGRRLAALGDARQVMDEVNRQAASPEFECGACAVLQSWFLYDDKAAPFDAGKARYTNIVPRASVISIRTEPDEDDPAELKCSVTIKDRAEPFVFYLNTEQARKLDGCKLGA